jgi:hypothetical protein
VIGTLRVNGYDRYNLFDHLVVDDISTHYAALRDVFSTLPADPYGPGLNRYRRYGAAIYLPWNESLNWLPATHDPELGDDVLRYYQGGFNAEHPGEVRAFPALPPAVLANPLLQAVLRFDYAQGAWPDELATTPFYLGVHFIKLLAAEPGDLAMTSPNHLHQDGEPIHFAHLIERVNASGGENIICGVDQVGKSPADVPEDAILERFTLTEPLQAYGICDHLVSHHLDPVSKGDGSGPGHRSAVLVDVTPMRKDI